MNGNRTTATGAGDTARPYILLPESNHSSHARDAEEINTNKPDPARIKIIESSLREMRAMAAQSPASMSFSNFHSLLMLPEFPRPILQALPPRPLNPQDGAAPAQHQVASTQAVAPPTMNGTVNGHGAHDPPAAVTAAATTPGTRSHPPMPPRIPHKLTPWEELSIRRDSEQQPYRDLYKLTGKRRRRHCPHPSWADGGIALPLISSKLLSKVEEALRVGICKIDGERFIAGGAGRLFAPDQQQRSSSAESANGSPRGERGLKRRRRKAGYEIGLTRSYDGEVDPDLPDYGDHSEFSALRAILGRAARGNAGSDDSDVESVYESEVDEWEVEVAHAIWLRSHAQSASPSEASRSRSKALAVPLSSNPTLLQVPLSEAERHAWNEEARQQRQLRLAEAAGEEGSQTQRDPDPTLPGGANGVQNNGGPSHGGEHGDDLEATLAIASQQMLYELTSGSKDGISTQGTLPISPSS
ncbi:hypothetical protein CF319_g2340 [Tilletia indica]|nr:hypothetical protein CF319_g2340 [Tilletia indica]